MPIVLAGRYRVEARLGYTRLAAVFRGVDTRLERPVLVYLLKREYTEQPPLRDRFVREAQHGARRTHRSLLEVYDTGDLAGRPYMVTEYVAGRTIAELGALSLEEALLYFRQIVGAVAACQSHAGPVPPISSAHARVIDDGHVELVENWEMTFEVFGRDNASYRPPERTAGRPVGPAGAVYSLGLLLYEMLIGRRIFAGTDALAVAQSHLTDSVPRVTEVLPGLYAPTLDQLLRRITARDPEERPQSAVELGQAIESFRAASNRETQRFVVEERLPSIRERAVRAVPRRTTEPAAEVKRTAAPARAGYRTARRSGPQLATPIAILVVCAAVAGCSYLAATTVAERMQPGGGISLEIPALPQLPSVEDVIPDLADLLPDLSRVLPDLSGFLPEWLTGVVEGEGTLMVVTISDTEGLNLRVEPGLQAAVIGYLPNGTIVRRIGGSRSADQIEWVQVRSQIGDQTIEGWVSSAYVRVVP